MVVMLAGTACTHQPAYNATAEQPSDDVDAAYARGDYATALQLNLPLANAGNAVAQFNLGLMYDKGNGVAQDYAEAARWFRKAADQGLAVGQFNLGVSYEKGQGLPQDYAEAAKWYRKAAEKDLAMAEYNLGILYAQGQGVPQDYVEAYKWFSLAASPFLAVEKTIRAMADKSRDMVAAHMTPAQIAEAQKLAREWKPTK
jgi:TPR repeat protein